MAGALIHVVKNSLPSLLSSSFAASKNKTGFSTCSRTSPITNRDLRGTQRLTSQEQALALLLRGTRF